MSASAFDALAAAPRGEPVALLHSGGAGPAMLYRDAVDVLAVAEDDVDGAFERLREFLARHADRACVGWLGYDLRDAVEALPRTIAADEFGAVPALWFAAFAERVDCAVEVPPAPNLARTGDAAPHLGRADYEQRVAQIVEHIRAGDVFQVNLTQPFSGRLLGDPRALFWRLCEVSPAPFAAYIETGDGAAVLSSSPEELLLREGAELRTRPIKGTRPRHADPAQDRELLDELLASDKDRAELAMIVDLLRNDFGKVARPGSVRVGPFPEHASFAQVHHLFATVTAILREGLDVVDVLRAIFPGGSITGAPKLRAMEIIEALEVARRGVYTGAIGRIGPGPRAHLNVAIRTMTVTPGGLVRCNAGGGVTADSDPAAEHDEMLAKAAGMLRALGAR